MIPFDANLTTNMSPMERQRPARASIVALSFPERFDPTGLAAAHEDARDFFPDSCKGHRVGCGHRTPLPRFEDKTASRSTKVTPVTPDAFPAKSEQSSRI
ncbi:hypothetical protein CCR94_21855 [Rhodoblastus sphagnicola]|uniref:Uncharacterized protein n=1 Tax=Rhodoblastus sphagnicola TaxID=333368 RepID=A0A2S6MWB8_9HYPH|nr:hypothetical protein CCR94_21855 [Rhodoblastus sphagnicola]